MCHKNVLVAHLVLCATEFCGACAQPCAKEIWWVPPYGKPGDISVAHHAGCTAKMLISVPHPRTCVTEMGWASQQRVHSVAHVT